METPSRSWRSWVLTRLRCQRRSLRTPSIFDTAMYCCFPGQIKALCMLFNIRLWIRQVLDLDDTKDRWTWWIHARPMGYCSLPQHETNYARTQNTITSKSMHDFLFFDIFITIQYSQSFMLFTFDCCIVLVYQCIIIDGVFAFFAQCMHLHVVLRSFRRRMTEASLEWPHVEVAQVRLSLWRSLATTSRRQDFPCFEAGPLLSLASNKGATQILIQIMMSNHQVSSKSIFSAFPMDLDGSRFVACFNISYHPLLIGRRGRKDGSSRRPGCGAGANHPNFGTSTEEQSGIFAWDWGWWGCQWMSLDFFRFSGWFLKLIYHTMSSLHELDWNSR